MIIYRFHLREHAATLYAVRDLAGTCLVSAIENVI